ncbi:MAG: hypothetical protein NT014_05770 [Candidatus Omnitrophica bacterium]|nr:hypothetical protein [Candidatus Omnitrophota bacterium]
MFKTVFSFAVIWLSIMVNLLLAQDFVWEDIGRENLNCQSFLIDGQNNKIMFIGKSGSILKTDNAGASWRKVLTVRVGFTDINDLAVEKNNQNVVYAATGNGLYLSNNQGEGWERIFHGKNDLEKQCMAVLSITQGLFVGTKAGLFVSNDHGRSWQKQQFGGGSDYIFNIEPKIGKESIIYLSATSGIFKSMDFGKSWEKIFVSYSHQDSNQDESGEEVSASEEMADIKFLKVGLNNSNLIYFSCSKGVYRSLNQGQSWEKLPEYGLLNRNVKMLCLSNNSEVYALTQTGVFLYRDERWIEVSLGLVLGKLNYLVIDNLNNLYIAGEKGVFKSIQNNAPNFKRNSLVSEYLKNEPSIKDVQAAAVRYAEVSSEKISQWRKDAARKAFLPQVNIGLDRNSTDLWHWEGGSTTKSDDDVLRRGRDNIDWDVTLSWNLGDLIWNDAQTSIDVRSKLMVELREDV